jgi:gamma-glutamylcyclotransferase (GGCT)/AIG2-like uncharacterized protein YtfP
VKYIAYGSNMVKEQMAYRCPDAKLIGTGYIERARLEFYLHATVERSKIKGARVPVAVWEISGADEQRLDRYEGFPNYYIKEEWPVTLSDGSEIKGMIYLMKLMRKSPPTLDYYKGIQSAYKELGLGSEIKTVLQPALCRSIRRMKRG